MISVVVSTSHSPTPIGASRPLRVAKLIGSVIFLFLSALFVTGSMSGCRSADPTSTGDNEQPLVRTTVAGTVVDEAGLPVSGAQVSAHGQTATSDKNGYFVLQNVHAPKDRCVAIAKMSGYFTAAKTDRTNENGLTQIKLFLMSHGARMPVNVTTGGTLTLNSPSGTASLAFEANGLVNSSGASFNGNAQVAVRHLDPADPSFAYFFAGDEAAVRTNGDRATLISYGVLRVDIRSANGDELQPAAGKPAVITYPIPADMLATAPATIPLWFFDEEKGIWIEEGVANKQGNSYVGSVTHFTDWNADKPSPNNGTLTGLVQCNGLPMSNVYVRIGQTSTYTGQDGRFMRYVPIGIDLVVVVDPDNNQGLHASAPMTVPMLTSRETRDITISLTSTCPTSITGTLVDDQDRPIAGHVEWISDEGKVASATTMDGTFHLKVPSNSNLKLEAASWACVGSRTFNVSSGDEGTATEVGAFKVCGPEVPTVGDIDISNFAYPLITLGPDGSKIAIAGSAPVTVIRSTVDGTLISTSTLGGGAIHYTTPVTFSSDGSRFSIFDYNQYVFVFDAATGSKLCSVAVAGGLIMPDGNSVLVVTSDSTSPQPRHLARFSVPGGQEIQSYTLDLNNQLGYVTIGGVTADGTRALILSESNIIIYDLVNDVVISNKPFSGPVGWGSMSADASIFSISAAEGPVNFSMIINTATGTLINKLHHLNNSGHAAISPDGTMAAVQDSTLDGTYLSPMLVKLDGTPIRHLTTDGAPGRYTGFSFSADGKKLAGVYRRDGKFMVRTWDL